MDDHTVRARIAEVEEALAAVEGLATAPRETALAAVGALVELYGEGWTRALARLERACPDAAAFLAEDELLGHLLMIHGLHPLAPETRVRRALREVKKSVDADLRVELLDIDQGVAHVRLSGNGTSGAALANLVEGVVQSAAPELERVDIELPSGAGTEQPPLVQIQLSRPGEARASAAEGRP